MNLVSAVLFPYSGAGASGRQKEGENSMIELSNISKYYHPGTVNELLPLPSF